MQNLLNACTEVTTQFQQAQSDNAAQAEAKALAERRRQARTKKPEPVAEKAKEGNDGARVDDFLASLRSKPDLGRRSQRRAGKPSADRTQRLSSPLVPTFGTREGDPVDQARGLLAQLTGNEVRSPIDELSELPLLMR